MTLSPFASNTINTVDDDDISEEPLEQYDRRDPLGLGMKSLETTSVISASTELASPSATKADKQTAQLVFCSKMAILIFLAIATAGCAVLTYVLFSNFEQDAFEKQVSDTTVSDLPATDSH